MIPALGAGGPGFNSQLTPIYFFPALPKETLSDRKLVYPIGVIKENVDTRAVSIQDLDAWCQTQLTVRSL